MQLLLEYSSPLKLISEPNSIFEQLQQAYKADMEKAHQALVLYEDEFTKIICLEDAPWARRISGVLGNELANQTPFKSHAVLTHHTKGGYTVSVRAPLNNKQGADKVVMQFKTGGGRSAAAGINHLPQSEFKRFCNVLSGYYSSN